MELIKLKDDPKYQGKPEQILSEDLNFILDEIVQCDDRYCFDLRDMIFEAIQVVLSYKDPKTMNKIMRCTNDPNRLEECTELYASAFAEHNPTVFQLIEQRRREISSDPLLDYDGTLYESPFWFHYAGDVWRRITHRSRNLNVERDCGRLRKLADQCLDDDTITHKECLEIYANSLSCDPGAFCPYLRQPLMTCMYGQSIDDYDMMRECITSIPNFTPCKKQYIAPSKPKIPGISDQADV